MPSASSGSAMTVEPNLEDFRRLARRGDTIPVYREIAALALEERVIRLIPPRPDGIESTRELFGGRKRFRILPAR